MKEKLKYCFLVFFISITIQNCNKIDLIEPKGFDTNTESDSIIFAVIGDFGKSGGPEKAVSDLVNSWNPDFIITTGDNNYDKGEQRTIRKNIGKYYCDYIYNYDAPYEYQCRGKAFEERINRFFPSLGNHDTNNKNGIIPYLNYFTLPGNEVYYKFVWGPVSFYSLNSLPENIEDQKTWLYNELGQSMTPYNIVYFHHSPYTPGPHGNNEKMQWDYYTHNVNVVLTGHDHLYARIEKNGEEGMYYIVNGAGGKSLYNCNPGQLSSELFENFCYNKNYGAIKVTATNNHLVLEFYSLEQPAYPIDIINVE